MPATKKVAAPRFRVRFQYAVKFLCLTNLPGTSASSTSVLPGSYQTAVNIHNPNAKPANYRTKLASGLGISKFLFHKLEPDGASHVDCANVQDYDLHPIHGFEGFLVVESDLSLDVVAVYTAGKGGTEGAVSSIDVEYVRERALR
jgi:hypothetical protein